MSSKNLQVVKEKLRLLFTKMLRIKRGKAENGLQILSNKHNEPVMGYVG